MPMSKIILFTSYCW